MKIYRRPRGHLQPWLINFGACVFLQTIMRDVAHDANNLTPRLAVVFEAQPPSKRGVYVAAEMNADKLVVHQNYRRRIVSVPLAQHAPSEKRNAKGLAEIFVNEVRERHCPLDRICRLGPTFEPITDLVFPA